jgi:eukaryotic-like serine/threonine-protein kinase
MTGHGIQIFSRNRSLSPPAEQSPSPVEPPRVESAWLVECFRQGDERAAEALFEKYFSRLTALVRARLSIRLQSRLDADDVVQSTYRSFFVRAAAGQFELDASGDLWRLLARMALHKLSHQVGRHTAEKRAVSTEERLSDANEIASREPSPDEAAAVADELEFVMRSLNDTERRTLELRLQGELLEAIAAELGQSERTVRRTLARVREIMQKRLPTSVDDASVVDSLRESERRVSRRESSLSVTKTTTKGPHLYGNSRSELATEEEAASDRIASPATLFDYADFILQQHIGEGLTGKVYRAWWKSRGREVAVKYLRRAHQKHPERIERFCEEARLVAGLEHPNIAAVHGLGQAPHGGFFIVLDWIDGPNLQCLLDQSRLAASPLAVQKIMRWMTDTARAVEYAHQHGVVHCDLKPSNLLLAPDGRVVLTDFGFARQLADDQEHSVEGGTLAFMAPEQFEPSFGAIGPHTDVYGWGAVLYTLLTGQPPHWERRLAESKTGFLPDRSLRELRPDSPDRVASVCEACLASNPFTRPASLREATAGWDVFRG